MSELSGMSAKHFQRAKESFCSFIEEQIKIIGVDEVKECIFGDMKYSLPLGKNLSYPHKLTKPFDMKVVNKYSIGVTRTSSSDEDAKYFVDENVSVEYSPRILGIVRTDNTFGIVWYYGKNRSVFNDENVTIQNELLGSFIIDREGFEKFNINVFSGNTVFKGEKND